MGTTLRAPGAAPDEPGAQVSEMLGGRVCPSVCPPDCAPRSAEPTAGGHRLGTRQPRERVEGGPGSPPVSSPHARTGTTTRPQAGPAWAWHPAPRIMRMTSRNILESRGVFIADFPLLPTAAALPPLPTRLPSWRPDRTAEIPCRNPDSVATAQVYPERQRRERNQLGEGGATHCAPFLWVPDGN